MIHAAYSTAVPDRSAPHALAATQAHGHTAAMHALEPARSATAGTSAGTRVWVLCGPKAGDNAQTMALAAALRAHRLRDGTIFATAAADPDTDCYETRRLAFRSTELLTNLALRVTLAGLQPEHSDPLQPPWPDLVITAGRRNEPVARWIRRASGGTTKLVHVGRPWSRPDRFDLVVTTPQYFVPAAANVVELPLPLHGITAERLAAAAAIWQPRLAALPRPWTALLIGGDSGSFRLTAARAARLAQLTRQHFPTGSLLVTTSARTPRGAVAALRDVLADRPGHFFDWCSAARDDNPYLGYLALADRFVVTAESASMLAEAVSTAKPLWLFDLAGPPTEAFGWLRWKPVTFTLAQFLAPRRLRRDIRRLYAPLLESGAARWLGDDREPSPSPTQHDGLLRAAARAAALLPHRAPGPGAVQPRHEPTTSFSP